jgi:hypothetical protein
LFTSWIQHLDASAGVDGVEAFIEPITATEFEDPDGHIIGFGCRPAAG